jgi:hypothetical protein
VSLRVLLAAALLAGCGGGPVVPDWRTNAHGALQSFERAYLNGQAAAADSEFARARAELARTGRPDLLARAELVRCAVRAASLEFDDCPGFEALRADAAAEEVAYADWLAGRGARRNAARPEDPLARLVAAAVQFRQSRLPPEGIAAAVDAASAQGWRRPLLAWLGVQLKRAADAGDEDAANRIRRRMDIAGRP